MFYIPVILGSIRRSRESLKVARFVQACLEETRRVNTELLDLKDLDLPMMEERLRFRTDPPSAVQELSAKIDRAHAIVIVTPEYNSGYPGVLKNALDYFRDEYRRKPFAIITVSSAWSGGILCLAALRQVILHLGGIPIPATLPISRVQELFDDDGRPRELKLRQRARAYFDELLWFTEALTEQKKKGS